MRRTTNQSQLALIEVAPSSPPRRVVDGGRRQRQAAINAHHCQVLLAELDRVANAVKEQRVQDLAALYDACERAQDQRAQTEASAGGAGALRPAAGSRH